MFKFGVDTFIWSEVFTVDDLWILDKAKELGFETLDIAIAHPEAFPTEQVKARKEALDLELVTTTTLNAGTNLIDADPAVRARGVASLKTLVHINTELEAKILGGVNYAGWGCLTGKPRTAEEWERGVTAMREVAEYAKQHAPEIVIAVEMINRFETHFLNVAADGVQFCKDVGVDNMRIHLDTFHMIREETSFRGAVETAGKEYLGYVHACENNRGVPGTGLVPWKEFFSALRDIGYEGPVVIESFDPSFEELNSLCAIWRTFAESGEALAVQGLDNLKAIAAQI